MSDSVKPNSESSADHDAADHDAAEENSATTESAAKELAIRDYSFAERGLAGLQPEISEQLVSMSEVFAGRQLEWQILAAQTWSGHSFYSLHHTGFAVDLAVIDVDNVTVAELVEALRTALGSGYRVLAFLDSPQPHLHVEYRDGLRISEPVDDPWQDFSNYA